MSASNVFNHLEGSPLRARLAKNEELTSLVMGLLGRLIFVCEVERKKPVEGMKFSGWGMDNGRFTAKFFCHGLSLVNNHAWGPRREFADFVGQKASKLALALHDNPDMEVFFQELVESIDQYSRDRSIPFDELMFIEHIITKDDVVVLKVQRRPKLEYVT